MFQFDKRAFNPGGPTTLIAYTSTAGSGVQVLADGVNVNAAGTSDESGQQVRVHNAGTGIAYLAFGPDAATAQSRCVIPTGSGSNAKYTYPLPSGIVEIYTIPRNCYFSVIAPASGSGNVFITPGTGL